MNKNLNNTARCSCARLVIKKNISLPHLKSKYPKFPLTVTDLYFFSYQPLPCVVSDCFSLPFSLCSFYSLSVTTRISHSARRHAVNNTQPCANFSTCRRRRRRRRRRRLSSVYSRGLTMQTTRWRRGFDLLCIESEGANRYDGTH